MKTLIATALVAAALLSAGAFANWIATNPTLFTNVTVIEKNQAWPLRTQMTVEPCKLTRCYDI
jgi:hypothetical protein